MFLMIFKIFISRFFGKVNTMPQSPLTSIPPTNNDNFTVCTDPFFMLKSMNKELNLKSLQNNYEVISYDSPHLHKFVFPGGRYHPDYHVISIMKRGLRPPRVYLY